MEFYHLGAQAFHVQLQLYFMVLAALMCPGLYFVEIVDAAFAFGGPGLGLPAHPFQLLFEQLFGFAGFALKS